MIEQYLRAYLLAQPAISALIGARLYPLQLPQGGTLPAVTYQRIAGVSLFDHQGPSDFGRGRIQFDCWAGTYAAMVALAEAVRSALAEYGARIINILDVPEPEISIWRRLVEISLWHTE